MSKSIAITDETVVNKIYYVRGKKVMLDRDLAEMYGVETRVLNQAVKRNERRFPADFMFQLTDLELENWKSQNVTSNKEKMGLRKLPNVFTEQGVAMLSSVLSSETAIEVNIQIIRIFTRIREVLITQALADLLGASKSAINSYELGQSEPTLSKILEIVQYFGCSFSDITDIDLEDQTSIVREPSPKYGEVEKLKIENNALREALREIGKGLKQ